MSQKTNVNVSVIKKWTTLDKFYEMFNHDNWRAQGKEILAPKLK